MMGKYLQIIILLVILPSVQQAVFGELLDSVSGNCVSEVASSTVSKRLSCEEYDEIVQFIQNSSWENTPYIGKPTDELIKYVDGYSKNEPSILPWLAQADNLSREGRVEESAQAIIHGISLDRTLLAFLLDDIQAVALPIIMNLAQSGDKITANALVSACAVASASPIDYLRNTLSAMPDEIIAKIWDEDPYVELCSFDTQETITGIHTLIDFQNREKLEWVLDKTIGYEDNSSVRINAGKSRRQGTLIVGWHEPFLTVSLGDAGLRVYIRVERPEPVTLALHTSCAIGDVHQFDSIMRLTPSTTFDNGWLCFDTRTKGENLFVDILNEYGWAQKWLMRNLERSKLEAAQIKLSTIGFEVVEEQENTYWIDRIELYIPSDSWKKSPDFSGFTGDGKNHYRVVASEQGEELPDEVSEQLAELLALGYVDAVIKAPSESGVTVNNPSKSYPGLNFYTTGCLPEVYLMDMDGHMLHTWHPKFDNPLFPENVGELMENRGWRRAYLWPNGDILALNCDLVLTKMDKDGNPIWVKTGGYHHDFRIAENGHIYILYREWVDLPRGGVGEKTLVDYIMILDDQGNELRRISLLKALEDSPWAPMLYSLDYTGDILHTNSIQILDGQLSDRIPAFAAGNVMVCMLVPSLVAVIDVNSEDVTWGSAGKWLRPHDPKLLPNSNLLIFDNHGPSWHPLKHLASRVLEINPLTQEVVWKYEGSSKQPFYSNACGVAWRLPNDNILITESTGGRAFEVTREQEIVWEYVNPQRGGRSDELVANILEMLRYPENYALGWLH